jgi:hypothetical protein
LSKGPENGWFSDIHVWANYPVGHLIWAALEKFKSSLGHVKLLCMREHNLVHLQPQQHVLSQERP